MTTAAAEEFYKVQHCAEWRGKGWVVFNPKGKPEESLPVIYGFNAGNTAISGFILAALIAEDGTVLGSHACSSEVYIPHDLGILEGARSDRHETFQKHYPDGYRMEFVSSENVDKHEKLNVALNLNDEKGSFVLLNQVKQRNLRGER